MSSSLMNSTALRRGAPRFLRACLAPRTRTFSSSNINRSSVSPEEVSHFNALAATWWDPHGSSRILHLMNPLRHDFIRTCHASQRIPYNPSVPATYLDIGCGGGIFAESAARIPNIKSVTAIDPSPGVLAIAKGHAKRDPGLSQKLTYLGTSIEGLSDTPVKDAQFDVVTLFEVIEHVTNPNLFLDQVVGRVKPGGWLIMSTIARHWMSYLTTKLVAEDIVGVVPRGTHDWNKYINPDELSGYFNARGDFGGQRIMGVVYVPGLGWKKVGGSESIGNYFFGVQKDS